MKLYEIWNESTGQPFVWGEMSQAEKDEWAAGKIIELETKEEQAAYEGAARMAEKLGYKFIARNIRQQALKGESQ